MARQFFGTDGIRGRINQKPMTVETALRLSIAAARTFAPDGGREVVVGRDTRRSGEMLEAALVSGLCSMGLTPVCVGVVPTPAVALLTREIGAAFGIMVTASHNKFQDNGLKLFSPEGVKFTDEIEERLESAMFDAFEGSYVAPEDVAKPRAMDEAARRYVERCLEAVEPGADFSKLNVVLDCANGAAYRAGPDALRKLGCNITVMGVSPNGVNINAGVGSTDTKALMKAVTDSKADIGIAFDGDADRLIVVDELGQEVDGDQVMALIATELYHTGRLKGGGMVATVMSNMGLAEYLKAKGLVLARTKVGDRYVGEHMRAHGFNLGGEQSGHIILSDVSTTGDGLLAALQVLNVLARTGKKASVLGRVFEPAPQELVNIRYAGTNPLETERVKSAIARAEAMMGEKGRLVVRKSGTEPLIRVMAEALEEAMMKQALDEVVEAVQAEA
ncbi:MAG: phosphoglucosamine mutase [Hyphomonas sp.]